jgi:hypothetical protein
MSENGKESASFEGWVILELMGHRRLAGHISEAQIGGASFVRIDVPDGDGPENVATQFYSPSAVYCITPTTEAIARKVAVGSRPQPVTEWELRADRTLPAAQSDDDDLPYE